MNFGWFLFAFGALFFGFATWMGRDIVGSRDRSHSILARVLKVNKQVRRESGGRRRVSYEYTYEIADGPHAGRTGSNLVHTNMTPFKVGEVVEAWFDETKGTIIAKRAVRFAQRIAALFVAAGGGLMIIGLVIA